MNDAKAFSEIKEGLVNILTDTLKVSADELTPEKSIKDDFNIDSMGIMELVTDIQIEMNKIGIEIEDEEIVEIDTIGQIYELVKAKAG